jgi:hypothetical protein
VVFATVASGDLPTRTVTVLAYDEMSGVSIMSLSNDPLMIEGVTTQPYTETVSWSFDERQLVYVRVEDAIGNASQPYPVYAQALLLPVYLPLVMRGGETTPAQAVEPTIPLTATLELTPAVEPRAAVTPVFESTPTVTPTVTITPTPEPIPVLTPTATLTATVSITGASATETPEPTGTPAPDALSLPNFSVSILAGQNLEGPLVSTRSRESVMASPGASCLHPWAGRRRSTAGIPPTILADSMCPQEHSVKVRLVDMSRASER